MPQRSWRSESEVGSAHASEHAAGLAQHGLVDHPAVGADGDCRTRRRRTRPAAAGRARPPPAEGVKTSLATATWAGWMQARPTNPSRARPAVDSRNASRSRKWVDTGAIGGAMPAARGGEHHVAARVEQLALVGPGLDARRPRAGRPRRPGAAARAGHPRAPARDSTAAALSSSGTTPAGGPQRGEQRVELVELGDRLGLGRRTRPVSAGAPATARTSASRSAPALTRTQTRTSVAAQARPARSPPRRGPRPCRRARRRPRGRR